LPSRLAEKAVPPPTVDSPAKEKPQLLNGVNCVLEYAVDLPDANKVEAYATKDGGQTWRRVGENGEQSGPLEFELPGDGTYGLVLVASTTSTPGQPPAAGETPDWWVEIDTTKPAVQMIEMHLGAGDEAGQVVMKWSAEAKHLGPNPVSLHWAQTPNGPWTLGAKGMKAAGSARWAVPQEAGDKFYLRLEATDMAGNLGRWESKEPISLSPEKTVHARIIGISVKH
jgi:hypothetical protein